MNTSGFDIPRAASLAIDWLLPPGAIVVLLISGLLLIGRRPGLARVLIGCGTIALGALSMPIVGDALTRLTGSFGTFDPLRASEAQAVVVLGGERRAAVEYGGDTVGELTLERLRLGARIARASGLPLLLSGGRFDARDEASMAELMQRVMHEDFGVPARWLDGDSRNTHENAARSAPILSAAGVRTIVLVTHYAHMNRAAREFTRTGIRVIPAPVRVPSLHYRGLLAAVKPSARALQDSSLALHELIGLLALPEITRTR
jgi:uncharacterized SAM-binding protein YcdF (DUF218 family)